MGLLPSRSKITYKKISPPTSPASFNQLGNHKAAIGVIPYRHGYPSYGERIGDGAHPHPNFKFLTSYFLLLTSPATPM